MQRLLAIAVFGGALVLSPCGAQQNQASQWRNFTDMKSVRSIVYSSGRLIAATGGGMFVYDETNGTYSKWTNSENLSTNDLTALMVDKKNRIWIGSSNGAIDVFDQTSNTWQSIQDIANSSRTQKAIREFLGAGDSVYVVSDFGVSVFIVSRWEFGDTYASFGFATQPVVSGMAVSGNYVFVATNQGIAGAPLSSPNLSAPTSWITYASAQGLPTSGVTTLVTYHDTLVAGTVNGLYVLNGSSFRSISSTSGNSIAGIVPTENSLFFAWNSANSSSVASLATIDGSPEVLASEGSIQASALAESSDMSKVYVGTGTRGVAEWDGSQWSFKEPNGPQSNLFVSLYVTTGGVVWAATGINGAGRGFYRYDPSLAEGIQWKNFTFANYPTMGTDDYYKVSGGANGSVWMSSWGNGVIEVVDDSIRRQLNSATTPSLSSALASNPLFVVIGGAAVDLQGFTWFADRTAVNGNYLAELVNDSTFQYVRCNSIPCDGFFSSIVVDQNGTKWMANSEPSLKYATGLYFYNEGLTVHGTESTAGWGYLSTSDGLPNNTILSLAVDQDNSVWVGTDLGVTIITQPLDPMNSMISSFPLREQSIQAIAVDGLNDKWIGTKEGVFVVNSDGTQLLNQYTVINTGGKLVDNDVQSIAIDQRHGIAYIGTQNGLSSLQIPAVQPLQSYAKLAFGPNPYTLPNSQPLIISNLVSNSTIKILAVNGTLVREFAAQGGGRAFWDGRDRRGNYVATGVYFIVAFADNGNQVANGKVAVIRK